MKAILALFILLFTDTAIGQTRKFHLRETNPIESNISIKNFHSENTFMFDGYSYLIGTYDPGIDHGLKMIVLNQQKNKIFESKGGGDIYYMRPYFFKTGLPEDGILVLLASGFEECSSSKVFHIKDGSIKVLGYLSICALIDGDTHNVEKYISISISKNELNFSFDKNEVHGPDGQRHKLEILYYDQDGQEQLVGANKVSYKYSDGELIRIIN